MCVSVCLQWHMFAAVSFAERIPFYDTQNGVTKWGTQTESGSVIISPQYDDLFPLSEDVHRVHVHGAGYGFVDKNGNVVVPPKYSMALDYSYGFAAVQASGRWGYIDKEGKEVISPSFSYASAFSDDGIAIVENEDSRHYIDASGAHIYKGYEGAAFSSDLAAARPVGTKLVGYIDYTGALRIPCAYLHGGFFIIPWQLS